VPKIPGDGTARGLTQRSRADRRTTGLTPDGALVSDLRDAAKLLGYATQPDGSLKEVTSAQIPL